MAPEIAMGLMIVTACPGGATSNLIAHLSKGDTALSISLTAFSSLITIFTIPFIINFFAAANYGCRRYHGSIADWKDDFEYYQIDCFARVFRNADQLSFFPFFLKKVERPSLGLRGFLS